MLLGGKDWDRKTLGRNGAKWAGKPKSFRVPQLIFIMWTTFSRWRMETTLFALHLWMHLSRYKGTFSPQFHAFGYEGRAGLLSPWLNKNGAVHSWFVLNWFALPFLTYAIVSHCRFRCFQFWALVSPRPTVFDSAYCYAQLACLFTGRIGNEGGLQITWQLRENDSHF